MIFQVKHCLFASCAFLATAQPSSSAKVSSCQSTSSSNNATLTSVITSPSVAYPPPGLLDSLSSMKIREDICQSDLSKLAARADIEPDLTWITPASPAAGVPASMCSIEIVYRGPLLPPTPTLLETVFTIRTSAPTPTCVFPGPAPDITPPTSSDAPPVHVAISAVWILAITFITISTLSTLFGGFGNALIVVMLINLICAIHLQPMQVEAHPDVPPHNLHAHHPHSRLHQRDPARRPIGGLRPGPVGKIPCGPVEDTIGTKGGHFVKGVHRKIGGLKSALPLDGDLYCDNWADANFPRSLVANVKAPEDDTDGSTTLLKELAITSRPPSDNTDVTTTIFSTTKSTLWVTVPPCVTAMTNCFNPSPSSTSPSAEETPSSKLTSTSGPTLEVPYSTASGTVEPRPVSLFETPYSSQPRESSAVPPAANSRTSFAYLLFLYLTGMLLCLLLGGSSYALSFLLISFALTSIIAGAEGAVVPDRYPRYHYGGRERQVKEVSRIGAPGTVRLNSSVGRGILEEAGLRRVCGEVFCHNWSNVNRSSTALVTRKPSPTYDDLVKRQSTLFITVPPTSGVIQIEGPQIIPITVVSTAYTATEAATVTVDAVTEQSTRTKVLPPLSTTETSTTPFNQTSELGGGPVKTVTSGEPTITVNTMLPPSPSISPPPPLPATETLWLKTTVTALLSWSFSSSPSLSTSSAPSSSPSAITNGPQPTLPPKTSQASHLDPSKLYLSFVETNLYCFLFLFIGLQIALTTSHPLAFLGRVCGLMVGVLMVGWMVGVEMV